MSKIAKMTNPFTVDQMRLVAAIDTVMQYAMALPLRNRKNLVDAVRSLETADADEADEIALTLREILIGAPVTARPLDFEPKAGRPRNDYARFVGKKVADLRDAKGMTQARLAEAAGLTQPQLSRLEAGEHASNRKTRERLAAAIGVDPRELDPNED